MYEPIYFQRPLSMLTPCIRVLLGATVAQTVHEFPAIYKGTEP